MAKEIMLDQDPGRGAAVSTPQLPPQKLNLRRLEQIQRLLQFGAALVLLVFLILIAVSYFQWRRIEKEIASDRQTVQKQRAAIEEGSQTITRQRQEIEQNKTAIQALQTVFKGLQEVSREFTAKGPEQGEMAKQTIEQNIDPDVNVRQIPIRIYFQIAREDQRKHASQVASQLQARGYIVPGIEYVGRKASGPTQLRYCQSDDLVKQDLDGITRALASLNVKVEPLKIARCGNVRPRHYEVWFGDYFDLKGSEYQ